jgi:hypothetical protein
MVHGLFMRLARIKRLAKTKKVSDADLMGFNFSLDAIIKQLNKQEEKT